MPERQIRNRKTVSDVSSAFCFFCLATAYNLGMRLLELPVIVYKIKNVLSKNDGKGKEKIINII